MSAGGAGGGGLYEGNFDGEGNLQITPVPEPALIGPGTSPRVLHWRYMFSAANMLGIGGTELTPCIIVATGGPVGDWAAYIAGVPVTTRSPDEADDEILATVASWGYKLTEAQARGFFPEMSYGWRYRQ